MENRLKLRLPRLFQSTLSSCRPKNLSDIIDNPVFAPKTSHNSFRKLEPVSSPKTRLFPTICRPETPRRPRVSEEHYPLFFVPAERQALFPPPASPIFPLNPYYEDNRSFRLYDKEKDTVSNKKKNKKSKRRIKKRSQMGTNYLFSSSSLDGSTRFKSNGSWWWSSSDEDEEEEEKDETDTLFSSRSFSSESSTSRRKNPNPSRKTTTTTTTTKTCSSPLVDKNDKYEMTQKKPNGRRNKTPATETSNGGGSGGETDLLMDRNGTVKDSFAVVKSSSDPYEDFRTSMVEMIVERQIFAAADLDQLLQCFLSLNSRQHHRVIIEVFLEIYEVLFSS